MEWDKSFFSLEKRVKDLFMDSLDEPDQRREFERALVKRKEVRTRFRAQIEAYEQEKLAHKLEKSRQSQEKSQQRSRRKTD